MPNVTNSKLMPLFFAFFTLTREHTIRAFVLFMTREATVEANRTFALSKGVFTKAETTYHLLFLRTHPLLMPRFTTVATYHSGVLHKIP